MALEDLEPQKSKLIPKEEIMKYDGKKLKIAGVEEKEVVSGFNPRGKQWVLRVYSEPIDINGENITASSLFNLKEEDGKPIGWSEAEGGRMQKFLDRVGVKHPKELIGKTALVIAEPSKQNPEIAFLGFVV